MLALIASEGYGKAWVSADVPFVWNSDWLGGTWTTGVSWSGASKAYSFAETIEFDTNEALVALENWVNDTFGDLTGEVALGEQVLVQADPGCAVISTASKQGKVTLGDHGWAPEMPEMRGIFYALGPSIAPGSRAGLIGVTEVQPLMLSILGLAPPSGAEPLPASLSPLLGSLPDSTH